MNNIRLIKISYDVNTAELLYSLLKERKAPISHHMMPSFEEHIKFIQSHPYRAWYLINLDAEYIGTVYISHCNTVGVNLKSGFENILSALLQLIKKKHHPLKAIRSVRDGFFSMNVSPKNLEMINTLDKLGATHIQSTYSIESI